MSKVNNIDIDVFDTKNFSKLTQIEKEIFEAYRDSILLIFPTNEKDQSFPDETIEYVEKSAFEFVNKLPDAIKNPVTIEAVLLAVKPLIAATTPAASSTTPK